MKANKHVLSLLLSAATVLGLGSSANGQVSGWLDRRGPLGNGQSLETGLPDTFEVDGENHLWSYELRGRGTPVIANGRVFAIGYEGEGPDLQEVLVCLDERTGERIWELRFSDFLSDVIYDRYSISSPTIDPATGNLFFLTSPGLLSAVTQDGELLWQLALGSEFGRLTFPNGRTGAPVIDDDLVIVSLITAHWGPQGPARNRFYAFDKTSGEHVWSATPGINPKDSPYSHPLLAWKNGKRVLYAGTGCGNVVCLNARTGDTLWRYQLATGGVCASVLLHKGDLIAIHGKENVDISTIGRMVSLKTGAEPAEPGGAALVLDKTSENWRNDLIAFTSSPVLVGGKLYQTTQTGEFTCVDPDTGAILFHEKLAPDQIHAAPVAADGKFYVPMNNGSFHVVRAVFKGGGARMERLHEVQLAGACLAAPAILNGRIYVHTTERLYCFGTGEGEMVPAPAAPERPQAGEPARLQVVPADVFAKSGEPIQFTVRRLDANGHLVDVIEDEIEWAAPPQLAGSFDAAGRAFTATQPGVGVMKAKFGASQASVRLRIAPPLPNSFDFDDVELNEPDKLAEGEFYAHPPGHWIGARIKWQVREREGEKVLARTLTNPLFQRAMGFIGTPDSSNYSMQIDLLTDGNRRTMSNAGVVNQRYLIQLKGNHQELEVSSNVERVKATVPYKWKSKVWYTLKTRVDVADDGSGVVRAKVWPRAEDEPEAWTIEVPHKNAHQQGAPGLFGFTPQSRFKVYVDNVKVTPND